MRSNSSDRNINEELIEAAKEIKAHKKGKAHPKVVSVIPPRNHWTNR